jgi:hypothetical protein
VNGFTDAQAGTDISPRAAAAPEVHKLTQFLGTTGQPGGASYFRHPPPATFSATSDPIDELPFSSRDAVLQSDALPAAFCAERQPFGTCLSIVAARPSRIEHEGAKRSRNA